MADLNDADAAELLRAIATVAPAEGVGVGEAALRAIVVNMPAVLVVIDPRGYIVWANRTSIVSISELLGRSMFQFMPPADQTDARAALERVVRTNRPDRYVGFGPGLRGPRSRYETWLGPIVRDDRVIAVAMITRDVSEEWELYEALRDREQRLSLVLRAAGMGTWRYDAQTLTIELDDHARAIYGLATARMSARAFADTHLHPEDRPAIDQNATAAAAERRSYNSRNRIIRTDGQVRWVEVTGSPIDDERGQLAGMLGTITDITERRELEAKLLQSQRLDAVGQLTAGIAHNFNNLLAAIMPTLSIIERDVKPSVLPLVQGAAQATARAADLVRQLMTFAGRNQHQERRVEAPGALVDRTLRLCRSTFDRGIELHVELESDLPRIRVDAGQIEQAVLNLLLNARDAVRDAGVPDPAVRVSVTSEPTRDGEQPRIAIVVEDNGPGVPGALRERIFDPFFTTKPVGTGTGLGLSTAYAIAREHGGDLLCAGAAARGARFTLLIPAVDAAPERMPTLPKSAPRAEGTVLVVDDDVLVRNTVSRLLDTVGFTVVTADNADHALDVLAATPDVAVVLLDLNMPGSSSWRTVVAAIRRDHAKVRVIAFTGGTTQRDSSVDDWLAKPASAEEITNAIINVMGRTAG